MVRERDPTWTRSIQTATPRNSLDRALPYQTWSTTSSTNRCPTRSPTSSTTGRKSRGGQARMTTPEAPLSTKTIGKHKADCRVCDRRPETFYLACRSKRRTTIRPPCFRFGAPRAIDAASSGVEARITKNPPIARSAAVNGSAAPAVNTVPPSSSFSAVVNKSRARRSRAQEANSPTRCETSSALSRLSLGPS